MVRIGYWPMRGKLGEKFGVGFSSAVVVMVKESCHRRKAGQKA